MRWFERGIKGGGNRNKEIGGGEENGGKGLGQKS